MIVRGAVVTVVALLALPRLAVAQDHELEAHMRRYLAPPEMVMRFQRQLEITDAQREIITAKVSELQGGVLDMQWELQDRSQALVAVVSGETVDVAAALEQLDLVLEIETAIKRNHMQLLLEIRNVLEPEQREKLRHLMEEIEFREMEERERMRKPGERESLERHPH